MVNQICAVAERLEDRLKAWSEQLTELEPDLVAQEKMISQPFAKQEELDQKRLRFNEIMAELNSPEEQQISEDESQD